jgi:hypothetical protein
MQCRRQHHKWHATGSSEEAAKQFAPVAGVGASSAAVLLGQMIESSDSGPTRLINGS